MKGRLFETKPVSQKNEIFEFFSKKPKPWVKENMKEYMWKTSIPEKWIDLKGESFFHHVSEANRPKLSIDLLQNTQQYFYHPRPPPKKPACSENLEVPSNIPKESSNKTYKRRFSLNFEPSSDRYSNQTFSANLLVPRPRTKEDRSASMGFSDRGQVQDFLQRFNKKQIVPNQPAANKGLFGWKLKSISKSKKRRSSLYKILTSKKSSERTFKAICSNRIHSLC